MFLYLDIINILLLVRFFLFGSLYSLPLRLCSVKVRISIIFGTGFHYFIYEMLPVLLFCYISRLYLQLEKTNKYLKIEKKNLGMLSRNRKAYYLSVGCVLKKYSEKSKPNFLKTQFLLKTFSSELKSRKLFRWL